MAAEIENGRCRSAYSPALRTGVPNAAVVPSRRLLKPGRWSARLCRTALGKTRFPGQIHRQQNAPDQATHARQVLMLKAAPGWTSPNTTPPPPRVLDRLGIALSRISEGRCCGASGLSTFDAKTGRPGAARNISDAWWPAIEAGAEVSYRPPRRLRSLYQGIRAPC